MICSGRKDHLPVRCPPQRREARSEARGKGPTCCKRVRGGGSGLRLRGVVVAGIVLSRGGRGGAMRAGWVATHVCAGTPHRGVLYSTVCMYCTVPCDQIRVAKLAIDLFTCVWTAAHELRSAASTWRDGPRLCRRAHGVGCRSCPARPPALASGKILRQDGSAWEW